MNNSDFHNLIEKYINNEATQEEQLLIEIYVQKLIKTGLNQRHTINWDTVKEKLDAKLFTDLKFEITSIKTSKSNKLYWFLSSAAAIIIVISSIFFIHQKKATTPYQQKVYTNQIQPGTNQATLILSDGHIIELNTISNAKIIVQNGVKINKTKEGFITYHKAKPNINLEQKFNTIKIPKGGQYKVILSDGTVVWINAESTITYPIQFTNSERRVKLNGEAYFEVVSYNKNPFIVETNDQEVEVLGTHFNINAYSNEENTKTTLLEGSVKVKRKDNKNTLQLVPGQQSILNSISFSKENVDVQKEIDWKNGRFIFKKEKLKSVMRKLERWYDIDVVYSSDFEDLRFSGKISRTKNLADILKIISNTNDIHFKIEERRITIMP